MKDDKTEEKLNNTDDRPVQEDIFPDWTLTPADVDIEAMLEEARRKMEETDETLEEYIERTMGLSLDEYIERTLAVSQTRQMTPDETQQIDMTKTLVAGEIPEEAVSKAASEEPQTEEPEAEEPETGSGEDMTRTKVVTEPIDWKKAEEEEAGYKGNEGRKTVTYGLTDSDVRDTIGMEPPEKVSDEIEDFNERIEKRKKDNAKRDVRNRLRLKFLLIALVTAIFLFVFSMSSFFTVDAIEVRGNSYFTAEEVINIAHAVPGRNLIYNTGSKEIIEYLEQNPYIKEAVVARKLPSTLVISITERKQACALKYDKDYLILDEEGILLKKTRTAPKITLIEGLVVSKIKLGEVIGTKDRKLFLKTQKLIQSMIKSDMYFIRVDMIPDESDSKLVKAYIYDTFVVKGDYDLVIANLENGRLHRVVEELFKQKIKRGTITFTEGGTISFEPGL